MRFYRASFVAGFAAGFVAGTRAGREKYDQMVNMAKTTAQHPKVQQAAGTIQSQASTLFNSTTQKVGGQLQDKVPQMAHTVSDRITGLKHKNGDHGQPDGGMRTGQGRTYVTSSSNPATRPGQPGGGNIAR